ncbi:TPA: binary toxin-like calcium binding domain-containing protein [Bacillus tropicus]
MKSQNIKKFLKVVPAAFVLSSSLLVTPGSSFAESPTISQVSANDAVPTGLLSYYFKDHNLKDLAFMTNQQTGNLSTFSTELNDLVETQGKEINSAFWKGQIQVDESGEYGFSTSKDQNVKLKINDKELIHNGTSTEKIRLEKGKFYPIEIVYKNGDRSQNFDLKLSWTTPNNKTEQIPEKHLFLPEMKKPAVRTAKASALAAPQATDKLVDTDSDGIPNALETNGYTVDIKNQMLIVTPWVESLHAKKGLTKYYSSANKWSTTSDPYSDFEKVTGNIDKQVKSEARNPLVAAYPVVNVDMEQIVMSKLQNVSLTDAKSKSNTVSRSTSNSKTNSDSVSVGTEISASLFDFGAKLSLDYTHEESSTVSIEDSNSSTSESSWSKTIGLNEGETAYLSAGIRYHNKGTAPIYNVAPTSTLVLGKDQSIVTVKAKENQLANALTPGTYYPAKGLAPITLNRQDDFGSTPITMNLNQVNILEKEKKLRIDTDQVSGTYATNNNGRITQAGNWSEYIPQIQSTTARLVLEDEQAGTVEERRVAAIDPLDPTERTKPIVTLGEALKLAFPSIKEKDGVLYYNDQKLVDNFEIVMDENTAKEVSKQLNEMTTKDIYKVELRAKMNLGIRNSILRSVDGLFENFRGKQLVKSDITRSALDTIVNAEKKLAASNMSKSLRSMQQQRINMANTLIKTNLFNKEYLGRSWYGPRFSSYTETDKRLKLYIGNLGFSWPGVDLTSLGSTGTVAGDTVTHILRDANDKVIKEWKGLPESTPYEELNINDYMIKYEGSIGYYYTVKLLDGTEYVMARNNLTK